MSAPSRPRSSRSGCSPPLPPPKARERAERALDGGRLPLRAEQADPARDLPRGHERDDLRHADGARSRRSGSTTAAARARRPSLRGAVRRRARWPRSSPAGSTHVRGRGSAWSRRRRLGRRDRRASASRTRSGSALVMLALAGAADYVSAMLRSVIVLTRRPTRCAAGVTGIEFAQVASAPSLGNVEAGAVASADEHPLLDRLRRASLRRRHGLIAAAFPALLRYDAREARRVNSAVLRPQRPRGGARADRRDVARRRGRRADRRGRGLRPRGPGGHAYGGRTARNASMFGPPGTRTSTARTGSTGA